MSRRAESEEAAELRIGEVAKLAGTTPRTIRYYEEIGLLPTPSGREPGAHRTYSEADVERLTEVLRLKSLLGLSLEELRDLLEAEEARAALRREWREGVGDPVRKREILEESLRYIGGQLDLARRRREEIGKLEDELVARRKRVRELLRELQPEPVGRRAG
ncbi:MAG: MerR family transcriptional regulator [Solirubrobacterales bacterium]